MEKQTRVNKYKNLRDEMKEEVAIDRHVVEQVEDNDDDFLAFIPKDKSNQYEDTLIEPLSYETLEKDNEEVRSALNEAKINVGKEQYNTRLDILNKIKQDDSEHVASHQYQTKDYTEVTSKKEAPQKKMSLLEKLAAMSPEEDAEELKKFEEDMTVADLMGSKKKKVKKAEPIEEEYEEIVQKPKVKKEKVYNDEDEEDSKVVTILNYVVLAFIVVLIVLAFFVVKQLLF